jgi:ferritin-like metal-binding protein YciE
VADRLQPLGDEEAEMAATSLNELFVEELRDMYDGEKRLLRALPKMARAATSNDLRAAFTRHAKETEGQVSRLEKVFRTLGEKPRGKKCDGIIGIVAEGNRSIEELDGPVLDAALIAGAQKVEHYEISSYGTLAYFAELLGHGKAKDLLGETLDEEKATDDKLTSLAKSDVNRAALLGADGAAEDGGMMAGLRRATSLVGLTSKAPSPRRTSSRKRRTRSAGGRSRRS